MFLTEIQAPQLDKIEAKRLLLVELGLNQEKTTAEGRFWREKLHQVSFTYILISCLFKKRLSVHLADSSTSLKDPS